MNTTSTTPDNSAASQPDYDVMVVGGGPAGATAANDLAIRGFSVLLLDRRGRIKPCGGAVPPQLLKDFDVPRAVLEAEVSSARMISPSARAVDMPIDIGFVGMVDRGEFDEWLRVRAADSGATRVDGTFVSFGQSDDSSIEINYRSGKKKALGELCTVRTRYVIGADGARSKVGRSAGVPGADRVPFVFAYHEIVETPAASSSAAVGGQVANTDSGDDALDPQRCDVIYDGRLSPDFYSWIFPHGDKISVGTGTAIQGFGMRQTVTAIRQHTGLDSAKTIRTEGAPIPMKPMKRWDDGKHVVLAGDAAGVVAPSSGEGIYYAMASGRMVADAVAQALQQADPRCLARGRKTFMKAHGKVFLVLGILQRFWYSSDQQRERFVSMCDDADVQRLTWEAYLNKRLVRRDPMAHVRVFFKDMGHLLGIVSPTR